MAAVSGSRRSRAPTRRPSRPRYRRHQVSRWRIHRLNRVRGDFLDHTCRPPSGRRLGERPGAATARGSSDAVQQLCDVHRRPSSRQSDANSWRPPFPSRRQVIQAHCQCPHAHPRSAATLADCLHEAMKRVTKLPRLVVPGRSIDKSRVGQEKAGSTESRSVSVLGRRRDFITLSPRCRRQLRL